MMLHGSTAATSPPARVRVVLVASIAALILTTFEVNAASVARQSTPATGEQLGAGSSDEFGSRRRGYARRGNAAGLAMMGMMIGTVGAVIAADQRRRAYRRAYHYPYGYGHGYGYPGHGYYAPGYHHHPHVYAPNSRYYY